MKHILIVDDNEENLYLLRVLLEGRGYDVEQAANGSEALDKARAGKQDMIISDILMPVMDGFTLCRALKADDRLKHIPLIFYTATYTDVRDEKLALDMGVTAFIVKPADPDEFMRRIEAILDANKDGKLHATQEQKTEDDLILKEYNEVLINKLEQKMLSLEKANKTLEAEIAARKQAENQSKTALEEIRRLNEDLERKISERTARLTETIAQLEELNRVFVGRELKMAELKKRVAELEKQKT
ncbi:MAG TPA: response regulator [Smithella sp.]|nr:response regulator [Smithella sp.]